MTRLTTAHGGQMKKFLLIAIAMLPMHAMATQYLTDYESVPPSQDFQILGENGREGDVLETLIVDVYTHNSRVQISDGASTLGRQYDVVPNGVSTIGPQILKIGARSVNAGWRVRTASGVSVFAVGSFH